MKNIKWIQDGGDEYLLAKKQVYVSVEWGVNPPHYRIDRLLYRDDHWKTVTPWKRTWPYTSKGLAAAKRVAAKWFKKEMKKYD